MPARKASKSRKSKKPLGRAKKLEATKPLTTTATTPLFKSVTTGKHFDKATITT